MKTSIKILLGLLLVIFMIPTIFLMAFNYKAKHGIFKPYDNAISTTNYDNKVEFGPCRFIKISSPSKDVLECQIGQAATNYYIPVENYNNGDSVTFRQQQDTLFINYVDLNKSENTMTHHRVKLYVNNWQQIDVDGVKLLLNEVADNSTAKTIQAINSELNFGVKNNSNEHDNENATGNTDTTSQLPTMPALQVNAVKSNITFNSTFNIQQLQHALVESVLKIKPGAAIGGISGHISADTRLELSGLYVGKMNNIVVK